ncbi:hypothetical protein [Sphingomonas crocodyli]|uniref:Uncharacterized protein n=1 Tax=Sphingomonas crocodyli TaxID=1979270 RepID=A0A437LYA3_9SPHN|nr:hypothetical protein [Sphingomonas crocodyli]RVT90408.1 hypothetical protein EOD43_19290 [Sphingomonas crocodyli]
MPKTIIIDDSRSGRAVVGDVVRFNAVDRHGPLSIDINLLAWTVLRDRNPDIRDAAKAVAALAPDGAWRKLDGARNLLVTLGPLVIEGGAPFL